MQQQSPLVIFMEENAYGIASITDTGPDGVSALAAIFQQLGARTGFVRLGEDIPAEAQVVVLIRTRRPLPAEALARLWTHLEAGNHLLLALDAPGHLAGNPDPQNGGLDRLLTWDYGITLLNGFMVSPTFTLTSITSLQGSLVEGNASATVHPIVEPLLRYDVPVRMWGARTLLAESLGVEGQALPLLNSVGFAETNPRVFRQDEPEPLEVNIGSDPQGELFVGAVSHNTSTQSRIAVLGDSESLLNGYGLAGSPPLHPGNHILAQRLAAWLLEIPLEEWPPLPSDFTWLEIDGDSTDWTTSATPLINENSDTTVLSFAIAQTRAFRDQDYLYLLVDTRGTPNLNAQLEIQLDMDVDGTSDIEIIADAGRVSVNSEDNLGQFVSDARFAIGASIELRLPLRVTGTSARITTVCLTSSVELAFPISDCTDNPISVSISPTQAPADLLLSEGLIVSVNSSEMVNLRAEPSTNAAVLDTIRIGSLMRATGRNEAGDWILVQSARHRGWIAAFLLIATGDLQSLPIIS